MLSFVRKIWKDFGDDECGVRAAALAYYTIFALPPLLILLILLVGLVWDPAEVQSAIEAQFSTLAGAEAAESIHDVLVHARRPGAGGLTATVLGVAALMFGALGSFMQLQGALNRAWEVRPDPAQGGWKPFVMKRILSLGMILALAFLLIVSLAVSAILSALRATMTFIPVEALQVVDLAVSFTVMTVLFAAIFKILPDAEIKWSDVWIGAVVTSLLFVIGKYVIGFWLGRSSPGDAYGTASALAVMLVWVYYAGVIVLFGAEFTQAWAERKGVLIQPEKGAVRMTSYEVASSAPRR
jgi:membrane protein